MDPGGTKYPCKLHNEIAARFSSWTYVIHVNVTQVYKPLSFDYKSNFKINLISDLNFAKSLNKHKQSFLMLLQCNVPALAYIQTISRFI